MKEKFKEFSKYNIIVYAYIFLAIFFELISICFIGCKFYLTKPLYSISVLLVMLSILFLVNSTKIKAIISSVLLMIQIVMNVGFIFLFDSNGTFFEWAMLSQRNDAFAILEKLSLRWGLVALLLSCYVVFIVGIILLHIFLYKEKKQAYKTSKLSKIIMSCFLAVVSLSTVLTPIISAIANRDLSYEEKYLYGPKVNKYQQMGISSNAFYEFFNGTIANLALKVDDKGIEEFIENDGDKYLETSLYHGISSKNNLVYIMVESFEWYVFLQNCTKEQSLKLFPNLNKFLNESVYANNFYSREKTDTAELLALIGSNPTNKYTNYDFPRNTFSWSLPNMFREGVEKNNGEVKQINAFHNNTGSFYNRHILNKSLGFDEFYSIEKMKEYGVSGEWSDVEDWGGEKNLDSVAVEKMQDVMFPRTSAGEQYMSYFLTFVMHGFYGERQSFKDLGYYDLLDSVGAYPKGISVDDDYLRNYAACVMDFDKAVGTMMNRLEENGDLDNTTIVMFADHNTYYNDLSRYEKKVKERYNSELYRVPFMIYDQKLVKEYEKNEGTREITKFTTTSDIIPTVLDLFGIQGLKNLYYGTSMFVDDVESVIFSRSYAVFVTDKLVCYSANGLMYTVPGFTKDDLKDFENRAKILLKKQEFLDKIYYNDYFKTHDYSNFL